MRFKNKFIDFLDNYSSNKESIEWIFMYFSFRDDILKCINTFYVYTIESFWGHISCGFNHNCLTMWIIRISNAPNSA